MDETIQFLQGHGLTLVLTTDPLIQSIEEVISVGVMRPVRETDASPLPWQKEFLEMYLISRDCLHGVVFKYRSNFVLQAKNINS
jgi:hypothetical protein